MNESQSIEADFWRELRDIEAESIGWQPLDENSWLHAGDLNATTVMVIGQPDVSLAGQAVLLVAY